MLYMRDTFFREVAYFSIGFKWPEKRRESMQLSELIRIGRLQGKLCCLIFALALALENQIAAAQTLFPVDAELTCTVAKNEFQRWFARNGSVVAPDSINFPQSRTRNRRIAAPECPFFKWAEHMFLWVTSRPSRGDPGTYVFDSSTFYNVSPLDRDMKRTLVAQHRSTVVQAKRATIAISQLGPEDEPVLFADNGAMHKIVRVEVYRTPDGLKIEFGRIEIERDKAPLFYDTQHDLIDNPILRDIASGQLLEIMPPPGNVIVSNGQKYFLDRSGRAVAAQPGQADHHVLMAQGDSLVYYMIHVNDVYAYFLTGQKNRKLGLTVFPTSRRELNFVKDYARDHGLALSPDEGVLIVELKSSWVELPDDKAYAEYVSIKADVPKFEKLSDQHWQQVGWRRGVKLAMVGMHVAFSVKGHPELIWATFEHVNNTPNAPYRYETGQGLPPRSQQRCGGKWLFSSGPAEPDPDHQRNCNGINVAACTTPGQTVNANGVCVEANRLRMSVHGGDINASTNDAIGPSDILRINPWGNSEFRPPHNTSIISINKSVRDQLPSSDVRKNYFMVGAIWLNNPLDGSGGTDCIQTIAKGSNCVANSTMETFEQQSNCLFCHRGPKDMLGGISRVYESLRPLFLDRANP